MNSFKLHQQIGNAFLLMETGVTLYKNIQGKLEFFSGFDQQAKIAAYEKMKFGYEQIINLEKDQNDQISILNLEIEEYNNQLEKMKQFLLFDNFQKKDEISDISQKFQFEMNFIQVNQKPNVGEDKILQLTSIKDKMKEIALPFLFPQFFKNKYGIFDHILIYGPPNSGKKYLVEYCSTIAKATLISLSISQLIKNQFDKPSGFINQIVDFVKLKQPSILLIYDLEQIRNQNLNSNRTNLNIFVELLIELDKQRHSNSNSDPIAFQIIGIISYPWNLDPPIRRRFSYRIDVPLPDHKQILALLKQKLQNMKNRITLEQFNQLTNLFIGYTCCDISNIIQMACDQAVNINKQNINLNEQSTEYIIECDDILNVLKKYKKTISQNYLNKLQEWKAMYNE